MITTSPVVRAALESDIEQITQLFLDSVDTSVPGITFSADPDYTPDKISPVLQKRLFPPRSHKTYVLELHTGEIVGYGNVKPDGGPNHDEDELDMFFVKVGLGGQGYGSQLMEAIQAEWGEHGLCVHVFQKNTRAIRFYERWGFQLIEGAEEDLELHMANGPKAETACLMRWPRTS
ncbi:acyl-CoA N-acyltransferase [Lentinus tigrinus ALCF2SS1-7]|uniref:Acyl-CoA N-acyltransferase n=1 Tax=Lentinus tigrinus ALCF2SS1-6 TaxID=1328759 RepID=A0A5C2SF96_9APHY|nr:acyl-CoA N-acyltransferase [Lentinus tigrinus ALCF2SS1-6]RPD77729.1 acyl-CoA N-acyltransferase [Lentinus tigrinus ALCF2SS1-7]